MEKSLNFGNLTEEDLQQIKPAAIIPQLTLNLTFTRELLKSQVLKRIENFSFYHSKSEHTKIMWVEFDADAQLCLANPGASLSDSKKYPCTHIYEVQKSESKPVHSTEYKYCFVISLSNRKLTLFCKTSSERDLWVYVLDLVAQMNKHGISVRKYNPFDVEQLLKMVANQRITREEESKQT
jgi:hypothetical protein